MAEPVPPSPLPTKPIKFATETRPKTSGTQSEKRAANTPLIAACRGANSSRLYRIRKLMAWASVFALRSEFGMGMRIDSSASTGATQGVAMANWQQKQQSFGMRMAEMRLQQAMPAMEAVAPMQRLDGRGQQ